MENSPTYNEDIQEKLDFEVRMGMCPSVFVSVKTAQSESIMKIYPLIMEIFSKNWVFRFA